MIVNPEQIKTRAEVEMEYYDSFPRKIRDIIKEYGEHPYHDESPEDFLARCEYIRQLEQEDLLLQAA